MSNQTAVEWLFHKLIEYGHLKHDPSNTVNGLKVKRILNQAKEIESEQMIEFALNCQEMFKHQIEEKYNETYGGNNENR